MATTSFSLSGEKEMIDYGLFHESRLEMGVLWAAGLNVPWFLAGAAGVGVPAGIAASSTVSGNSRFMALVRAKSCHTAQEPGGGGVSS